jgi:hypothetical protein
MSPMNSARKIPSSSHERVELYIPKTGLFVKWAGLLHGLDLGVTRLASSGLSGSSRCNFIAKKPYIKVLVDL